jgi:DNA repair photolyase
MKQTAVTPLSQEGNLDIYKLKNFNPIVIDYEFIRRKGIDSEVSKETINGLTEGCLRFKKLLNLKQLTAPENFISVAAPHKTFEVHNYTGKCPTNVFELNPAQGSCSISCMYCLVTDGDQVKPITVFNNYPQLVSKELDNHKDQNHFFYYSPKTEAFAEPLLQTGIAHEILRTFRNHYEKNPDSRVRLFIATKAGPKHLDFKNKGESILDILGTIGSKVQLNGSMGIMPDYLHKVLEPNAPSLEKRIEAMQMCQQRGIYAYSVLSQPIIPSHLTEETAEKYISKLAAAGIQNIKPEFLTANMQNIAIIAQYIHHFDPNSLKAFLETYISKENSDHIKQRCRTAPDRNFCYDKISMISKVAKKYDVSISLCNWVKNETRIDQTPIEDEAKRRGFRCLGYQENMFRK